MKKITFILVFLLLAFDGISQETMTGTTIEYKLEGQDCHDGKFYIGNFGLGTYEILCNVQGFDANYCGWKIIIGRNYGRAIRFTELFNNIGGSFYAEMDGVRGFDLWWLGEYKDIEKIWTPRLKVDFQGGNLDWETSKPFSSAASKLVSNVNLRNPNVGIGTHSPQARLDVAGAIRATEIKVEAQTADFVFEDNYPLRDLNQVEEFIQQNKHLPDIPSAEEMEASGVNLAEMNKLLLQKIEELTLYTIEKEKEILELREKDKTQQERVETLEGRLTRIEQLLSKE